MDLKMDTTSFTKKSISGVGVVEPALTPPTLPATQTTFAKKTKIGTGKSKTKKRDIPEGLWTKCPTCETMIFDKELDENLKVCMKCGHHFAIGSRERIHSLVETCTFEEMDATMSSVDMSPASRAQLAPGNQARSLQEKYDAQRRRRHRPLQDRRPARRTRRDGF